MGTFIPGQRVWVLRTGSLGVVQAVRGSIIVVLVEDRYSLRFDRSQVGHVPGKAGK